MSKYVLASTFALLMLGAGCDVLGPEEGAFVIQNRSQADVTEVFIDPCGESAGVNRLGSAVIPPNGERTFGVAQGCYDVLARTEVGTFASWPRLEVNEENLLWTLPVGPAPE